MYVTFGVAFDNTTFDRISVPSSRTTPAAPCSPSTLISTTDLKCLREKQYLTEFQIF